MDWITFLGAVVTGLGSGFTVNILNILHQERKHKLEQKKSVSRFVDNHLDPLLKSADELVGKLCSLTRQDFKSMSHMPNNPNDNNDYISLFYLLAKLWSDIEIIRREGLSVAIAEDDRGAQYQTFVSCLQSKHFRLVDRITQRAIGELMIKERNGKLETISFIQFFILIEKQDPVTIKWMASIIHILSRTGHKSERQILLQYGIIVHAMIDTLDYKYEVTKKRPSYPNKLTTKSRKNLYNAFDLYLKFVNNAQKYIEGA